MAQSAKLWPQGENKELLIAIANYTQYLVDNHKSLDELYVESLQTVTESLQTIICPDDDQLPKASFSLEALYNSFRSGDKANDDEKSKPLPKNIAKRREKFLEFLKVLETHDFFKGCTEGSAKHNVRMEKARSQYNSRFPKMSIDHLSWIEAESGTEPMDTDEVASGSRVVSDDDKRRADELKAEGNKLLQKQQFEAAVAKYSAAIELNDQNAVYFSNRAAAHTYLKHLEQAVADSRRASAIDPDYVKAYVREGLAEYELGHFQKAHDAYSKALEKTKPQDKNWENYMEKVELCQMKLDEANSVSSAPNTGAMPGSGGGGAPDLSSLLGSLGGGGGGGGGLDFGALMNNPMMKQMAEQMMKDPESMKKMGEMLGGMGGMGGSAGGGGNNVDTNQIMADLLQNPQKAQALFKRAMADPEVKQMMRDDPTIEPLIKRIQSGDYAAFMELGGKPQAMAKVKGLIAKYYNNQ